MVGSFVTVLNQTLVTPALPTIMQDLNVDAATVQWLTTGFTLTNAIMIPITAYFQERFSTRSIFVFSMLTFGVGAVLAGWAPNFTVLLCGRIVQAVGAGILMPLGMTVLLVMFPVDRRGSAMGLFGLVIAFAPAVGPTVGGIVVDRADWHIMFFAVAFFAFAVGLFSVAFMEKRALKQKKRDVSLDPLSVVLSTLGFGTLLYGFSAIGSYGFSLITIVCIVIGAALVVWFFYRQTHLEVPMLRVKVLYNRKFLVATIIGMLVQASLLAAGILMPIYVQTLLGYPATISGLVMMPGAIIMGIMNPVAGKLFDKHGPRVLGVVGMVLLLITSIAFGLLSTSTALWFIVLIFVMRMFSIALVNMPITTWGMNSLDTSLLNHGTSVNNTLRQVAGSLGTAIVISVSTNVQNAATGALGVTDATMLGIDAAFMVAAVLVLIGLVLTVVFVKDRPGATESVGREAREGSVDTTGKKGDKGHIENVADKNSQILRKIMKSDVYTLYPDNTVMDAMQLFIDKKISACPIVTHEGEAVGFISDGDILNKLSRQSGSYMDPIVLISATALEETDYDEKVAELMHLPVKSVGIKGTISVNVHADLEEVCRVLAKNHLKKVPVIQNGKIVGIINRSDITQYSMETYLQSQKDVATKVDSYSVR